LNLVVPPRQIARPSGEGRARHVLVVANETVAGKSLADALDRRAAEGPIRITVVCPISQPREGYVVYQDTRRAAARRRLDRTLELLRAHGIAADGFVVEADPVEAVRDSFAQLEPPPDEIVVSTHPEERSGWLRRHVVERIRSAVGDLPVDHVVVDLQREGGPANVLVIANETVVGSPLLDRIRQRSRQSPASFLLLSPQSDPSVSAHPEAEQRLRFAVGLLRGEGIDVHGEIAHPDPYTAAVHAVRDERVDEIVVSTFPGTKLSSWLRGNLVERLRKDTGLPVEHVEGSPGVSREILEVG
jgi:hypothetical protein